MTDLDTVIKDLVNVAVDRELGDRRPAPEFDPPVLDEKFDVLVLDDQPAPAGTLRPWSTPMLAAAAVVLLAVGAMVAITLRLDQKTAPANLRPAPSHPTYPPVYFPEARGVPEAEDVPGVSIEPISDVDARTYKDLGFYYNNPAVTGYSTPNPKPGEPYSFTVKYIVDPKGEPVYVLSWQFEGVKTGDCPGPVLVRPGHTYLLHCTATLGPDGRGTLRFMWQGDAEGGGILLGVACSECRPWSEPGSSSGPSAAAVAGYRKAAAGAPEATEVPGVSVGPASTGNPGYTGLGGPFSEFAGTTPVPGTSYPFTVEYLVHSRDEPEALLSMRPEDVVSGSCPRPFLIRPGHTYRIRCQVTFRSLKAGRLAISRLSPTGRQTVSTPLLQPDG
jgi:hypothetical protein